MIDKTVSIIKPNTTPVLFVNWREKDFDGVWDKVVTTIKAGESIWIPFWLAEHFAKHLVDDYMNDQKLPTDHHTRESFVSKCIGNKKELLENKEKNDDPLGIKALNKNMNKQESKSESKPEAPRRGRPKKVIEVNPSSSSDEETFEGK